MVEINPDNRLKPTVITSAFVEKDGKYLVTLCPRFRKWRVPGGKVEFDENVRDTLVREMKEELGVEVEIQESLGFGQDWEVHVKKGKCSRLILYFLCSIKSGEINVDPDEALDHRWVTLDEMKQLELEGALNDLFTNFEVEL